MEKRGSIGGKACTGGRRKRKRTVKEEKEEVESAASTTFNFMSNAPEDVLHEILIRLPDCKSAAVCSTVCKRWFSVISNTDFINTFNRRHSNSMQFTFLFRWLKFPTVFDTIFYELSFPTTPVPRNLPAEKAKCLDFLPWPRRVKVRACCGGFLLLSLTARDFFICNPLTKQWRFLPRSPTNNLRYNLLAQACGLSLRPKDCNDSNNIKFKAVLAEPISGNNYFRASVFCSESRQWTKSVTRFPYNIFWYNTIPSVTSNGILYWLGGYMGFKGILAFDPFKTAGVRRCRFIHLPRIGICYGWRANKEHVRLGVVQGRLRLSHMFWVKKFEAHTLKIWELNDSDTNQAEEWRLMYNVRPGVPEGALVIGFHPDDSDVMFLSCDRDVCRYEIAGDTLQNVGRLPISDADYHNVSTTYFWLQTFSLAQPSSWPKLIPRLGAKKRKRKKLPEIRAKKRKDGKKVNKL